MICSGCLGTRTKRTLAEEIQEALIRHIRDNTAEDDERREAERDVRIAEAIKELGAEGKPPPRTVVDPPKPEKVS